jgi:DNA repair exonuclease SbcCD ATPase subunit
LGGSPDGREGGGQSSGQEDEKGVRGNLDARIEAEKRKARGAEALRKELGGVRSKMESVESRAEALERRMRELGSGQDELEKNQKRLKTGTRRVAAALDMRSEDLSKIERASANLGFWRQALVGTIGFLLGALTTLILLRYGEVISSLL